MKVQRYGMARAQHLGWNESGIKRRSGVGWQHRPHSIGPVYWLHYNRYTVMMMGNTLTTIC